MDPLREFRHNDSGTVLRAVTSWGWRYSNRDSLGSRVGTLREFRYTKTVPLHQDWNGSRSFPAMSGCDPQLGGRLRHRSGRLFTHRAQVGINDDIGRTVHLEDTVVHPDRPLTDATD